MVWNVETADHPGIGLVEPRLQQVLAIDGEIMTRGDAAPRSERKFLAETIGLPQPRSFVRVVLDSGVALERRLERRIADGEPRDFRRRGQIAIEQRRDDRQRIGVGVEAVGLFVGRQDEGAVNLHAKQIADGIRVFSAVETMQVRGPARVWVRGSCPVELTLEPRRDSVVGMAIGPPAARRRHRARPQLRHDLFPGIRRARHASGVVRIDDEIAGLQLRVMTRHAVCRDHLACGRCRCWPASKAASVATRQSSRRSTRCTHRR